MLPDAVKPPERFDKKVIGDRIRKARKAKRWSTEDLAKRAGIGVDSLYKKQRGEIPIYLEELNRICDALGAPRLFPFLDWAEALLVDRLLKDHLPHP